MALGGSAVAAGGLIQAKNIAVGAVTSAKIKDGTIEAKDVSRKTRKSLQGKKGAPGLTGLAGAAGSNGANGVAGVAGAGGSNGANGANGPNGADGADGVDGTNGTDGTNGIDGQDGIDGTVAPLSATQGNTLLPTATPPTVVVEKTVPAGKYVILAKTQLTHSGAGDSITCVLKAGTNSLDQIAMKTLPALAAIPASLQAVVTTTVESKLSLECDVTTANGSADFSSLIAIPTA